MCCLIRGVAFVNEAVSQKRAGPLREKDNTVFLYWHNRRHIQYIVYIIYHRVNKALFSVVKLP